MMKDIVIIGAGGFGKEVAWLIEDINKVKNEWNLLGFLDGSKSGIVIGNYEVIGDIDYLKNHNVYAVLAIGDPNTKEVVLSKLSDISQKWANLIHPNVMISPYVKMGKGNIICAGSIITTDIIIGNHIIINLDCTVGHDVVINDYCTILPSCNVSGHVSIGKCTSIGTGTQIIQEKLIGENCVIGAGSVVTKNIEDNSVAVGIPARVIKKRVVK